MQTESSVFNLLAAPVQKALAELGFIDPTMPQTKAFPAVLNGENVLLVAHTGSGKTEAVLLPVFSKLLKQPPSQGQKGIRVLYIAPLRALNRDMLKRLTLWARCTRRKTGSTWTCLKRRFRLRTREYWDK